MIRGAIISCVEGMIKRITAACRAGETISDREYFQHYGYSSRPRAGAEIIIIREGGHFIAIASDDRRYRISLEDGEVALYTDEGDKIHLKRNRIIEIVGGEKVKVSTKVAEIAATVSSTVTSPQVTVVASTKVTMTTPLLEVSGNITAGGHISAGTYIYAGSYLQSGTYIHAGSSINAVTEVYDQNYGKSMSGMRGTYNGHQHLPNSAYGPAQQM